MISTYLLLGILGVEQVWNSPPLRRNGMWSSSTPPKLVPLRKMFDGCETHPRPASDCSRRERRTPPLAWLCFFIVGTVPYRTLYGIYESLTNGIEVAEEVSGPVASKVWNPGRRRPQQVEQHHDVLHYTVNSPISPRVFNREFSTQLPLDRCFVCHRKFG